MAGESGPKRFPRRRAGATAAAGALALLALSPFTGGCGGAGTGASLNSPSLTPRQQNGGAGSDGGRSAANIPTQRLNLFLTAAFPSSAATDKNAPAAAAPLEDAHLWVTIHKVELLENDEQRPAEVVFEDAVGRTTDLAALRDGTRPRVELIARSPVGMARKTTRVRLTFGKAFQRFAPGAEVSKTALFAESVARDAEGRPILTATLSKPRDLATGKESLVLALGLAESAAKDGTVVPVIKEVQDDALRLDNRDRQVPVEFAGSVGDVTGEAPSQSFVLMTGPGRPLSVRLSPTTVLTNADDRPNPALAGAKRAVALGRLDNDSGALLAESVTLYADEKSASADASRLRGAVSDVAADGSSFVLRPAQVAGVQPTQTAVTVSVGADAVLRSRGGLPLERDALKRSLSVRGALAEVEGLYEPSTATLTARRVRVTEAGAATSREALLQGASVTVDADGTGLTLKQFVEWDGVNAPAAAKAVPVGVTGATAYVDQDGKKIDSAAFFAALKGGGENAVRALGLLSGDGKMTATRLELRPAPPKPAVAAAAKKPAAEDKAGAAAAAEAVKADPAPKTPEKK